ncbi:enoyl-CoA hydratase/isomerase family protein [Chloroflexota bacterium]
MSIGLEVNMEFSNIILKKKDNVVKITLNRPEKRNALGEKTLLELEKAMTIIEQDQEARVVMITGRGKAFCAGADLTETEPGRPPDYFVRLWNRVFWAIENLGKPTIAVVNGMALAGGLELLQVCDLAIAAEDALLGDQHANFGLIPGGGSTQRLPRLIGVRKAKELIYTGDWISAAEAERLGLVNKVVPVDKLQETADEMAKKLASKSPMAIKTAKRLINRGVEVPLTSGLEMEIVSVGLHSTTEDMVEGLKAFGEKREPQFPGK